MCVGSAFSAQSITLGSRVWANERTASRQGPVHTHTAASGTGPKSTQVKLKQYRNLYMMMKNQSTKSWSVVVPVSGRCWLNARHALRNSSEGLYLKKKYIYVCMCVCIYISVSMLIKKKSPLPWLSLSSFTSQQLKHPNWATSQGGQGHSSEILGEYSLLTRRLGFWTLLKSELSALPFGSCCFQGAGADHQSILGATGPSAIPDTLGKGELSFWLWSQHFLPEWLDKSKGLNVQQQISSGYSSMKDTVSANWVNKMKIN